MRLSVWLAVCLAVYLASCLAVCLAVPGLKYDVEYEHDFGVPARSYLLLTTCVLEAVTVLYLSW